MFTKYVVLLSAMLLLIPAQILMAQTPWQQTTAAGVVFEYRVTQDGLNLEGKVIGQSTGWVGVGFNPTTVMRDANIIIGYVSGAISTIRDDWGTSDTAHASDLGLGGTTDVTLIEGMEVAGVTTLHFTLPLASVDQYDRPLAIGQTYTVILARGSNSADNFTGTHTDAGYGSITLQAPVSNEDNILNPSATQILGNYPNPFRPSTTIRYQLAEKGSAELSVFNARGQIVHSANITQNAGEHGYLWQAGSLPSGTYIVRLKARDRISQTKVNLMK